jgi:hypothetical protein
VAGVAPPAITRKDAASTQPRGSSGLDSDIRVSRRAAVIDVVLRVLWRVLQMFLSRRTEAHATSGSIGMWTYIGRIGPIF